MQRAFNHPISAVEIDFQLANRDQLFRLDGSKLIINVASHMDPLALGDLVSWLSANGQQPLLITSLQRFYASFRRRAVNDLPLGPAAIVSCRKRIAEIIAKLSNWQKIDWLASEVATWTPSLHPHAVRWGNVEMRTVESYIWNRVGLFAAAREMALELRNGSIQIKPPQAGPDRWYSSSDLRFNVQALMTNAGFLLPTDPEEAVEELELFCTTYLQELSKSHLFVFPHAYPFFLGTLEHLRAELGIDPPELNFPGPFKFYKLIENRKILISTPFADEINHQFNSGSLFELYNGHRMPRFHIKAIKPPMSVHPRRPHHSWRDALMRHCGQIDEQVAGQDYDLYMASAGCYGIPLCAHVRKSHGIPTLYYGNHINTLLGIMQNCSIDFMRDARNESAWIRSTLGERYPELHGIDGGRYL